MKHLDSLHVKNFRSLEDFTVEKLGDVNLIVGRNNSGKSSVLEALYLYATNGAYETVEMLTVQRDELSLCYENEKDIIKPYINFFNERAYKKDAIFIGNNHLEEQFSKFLRISYGYSVRYSVQCEVVPPKVNDQNEEKYFTKKHVTAFTQDDEEAYRKLNDFDDKQLDFLQAISISSSSEKVPYWFSLNSELHNWSKFYKRQNSISYISTKNTSVDELASIWSEIQFDDDFKKVIIDAIQTVESKIIQIGFRDKEPRHRTMLFDASQDTKTALVKLEGVDKPIPLKSMGDGIFSIFEMILKCYSAQNGFLLIDEFENGLHYSIQKQMWDILFKLSKKLNIQIFATTHSWDTVESFAQSSKDNEAVEGILFRMGKSALNSNKGQIISTVFDEERLYEISQKDIEVR